MTGKQILILVFSLFALCLGKPDCTSSSRCDNIWVAKECKVVKECIQEWAKAETKVALRDDVCSICLEMVKEARDVLSSNETREELQQVFEGSCRLLTVKPIVKLCDELVDQFVPELVDMLSSQMDPQQVCSVARLCNDADVRRYQTESSDCLNCQKFVYGSEILLRRRVSAEDFKNGMLKVCRSAGSYSDACSHLGIQHAGFLYELTKSVVYKKPCEATLVCPIPETVDWSPSTPSTQPLVRKAEWCPICRNLMANVRERLLRPRTAEGFAENVFRMCKALNLPKSTCSNLASPEFYEKLKSSETLPELFCQATFCKEKSEQEEDVPVWPLVSESSKDRLNTDFFDFLTFSDSLLRDRRQDPKPTVRPTIAYGDRIGNPMFFDPVLSQHFKARDKEEQPIVRPTIAYGDAVANPMFFDPALSQHFKAGEKEQQSTVRPTITYGDPVANPVFFGPALSAHLYTGDKEECDTCNEVLEVLSEPVRNDDDYLNKMFDIVCIGVKHSESCKRFIDKFSPLLTRAFAEGGVSKELCADLVPSCQVKRTELIATQPCSICLHVMRVFKDGNSTLLSPTLQQKCKTVLGSPEHICKDLSFTFENLVTLLKNSNETQACRFVKLCPSSETELQSVSMPTCHTCMLTMQSLVDVLKSNSSNDVIETVLDSLCRLLPHVEKRFCYNIINNIGVEGFKRLIEHLNSTEICNALHICHNNTTTTTTTTTPSTELSTQAAVTRSPDVWKVPCKFCMMAVKMLLDQLQDDKTEESIRKALDSLCQYFPEETRDTCRNLIEEYADALIDMIIADFNATEICTYLKLCPVRHLIGGDDHDKKFATFDVNTNEVRDWIEYAPHEPYKENETVPAAKIAEEAFRDFHKVVQECAMCEALVGVIISHKSMLDKNYDFSKNAYRICSMVPKDRIQMCTSMIVSYGPSMVNLLLDHKIDPNEVCVYIDLCDAQMRAKVNQPVSVLEPKVAPEEKNDCMLGPVFWCASAKNAEKCGTFLHCQETVWKNWKSPPTRRTDNL